MAENREKWLVLTVFVRDAGSGRGVVIIYPTGLLPFILQFLETRSDGGFAAMNVAERLKK